MTKLETYYKIIVTFVAKSQQLSGACIYRYMYVYGYLYNNVQQTIWRGILAHV